MTTANLSQKSDKLERKCQQNNLPFQNLRIYGHNINDSTYTVVYMHNYVFLLHTEYIRDEVVAILAAVFVAFFNQTAVEVNLIFSYT